MASMRNRIGSENDEILTLHEVFRIVGDQMTPRDVRVLKFLYTDILCEELKTQIHDGFTVSTGVGEDKETGREQLQVHSRLTEDYYEARSHSICHLTKKETW